MSADEAPAGGGAGGLLAGLLAPLRLPERAVVALDTLADAARGMSGELTRVREQTEPLAGLMPAVERIIKQTEMVPGISRTVEQIRKQAEPLAELLPALERLQNRMTSAIDKLHETIVGLEGEESHLNKSVRELVEELHEMHRTVGELQGDVQRITDRIPDPSRSPIEKARDVLTGSGD